MNLSSDSEDNADDMSYKSRTRSKKRAATKTKYQDDEGEELYFQDGDSFKESGAASRRRQELPKDTFNKHLEDIIDCCVALDRHRIFTQRVKPKDAPNYFTVIKNPIDLSIMKGKTKRRLYKDLTMFRDDIALMKTNAVTYNGQNHFVSSFAQELQDLTIKMIQEKNLDKFEL